MVTARRETAIVLVRDLAFAYVEGLKAQTRRVVKLSDPSGTYADYGPDNWPLTEDGCGDWSKDRCPYGVPGDRLRMLTGWATEARFDEFEPSKLPADARIWSWFDGRSKPAWAGRLRVGRHLPKRLRESMPLAELVSVRVERLNEISEADAIAEGMLFHNGGGVGHSGWRHDINYGFVFNSARKAFAICWDACTPKHPWLSNPFVWVVEFKRMEAKRCDIIDDIDRAHAEATVKLHGITEAERRRRDARLDSFKDELLSSCPTIRDRLRDAERKARAFDLIASKTVYAVMCGDTWAAKKRGTSGLSSLDQDLLTAIEAATKEPTP